MCDFPAVRLKNTKLSGNKIKLLAKKHGLEITNSYTHGHFKTITLEWTKEKYKYGCFCDIDSKKVQGLQEDFISFIKELMKKSEKMWYVRHFEGWGIEFFKWRLIPKKGKLTVKKILEGKQLTKKEEEIFRKLDEKCGIYKKTKITPFDILGIGIGILILLLAFTVNAYFGPFFALLFFFILIWVLLKFLKYYYRSKEVT